MTELPLEEHEARLAEARAELIDCVNATAGTSTASILIVVDDTDAEVVCVSTSPRDKAYDLCALAKRLVIDSDAASVCNTLEALSEHIRSQHKQQGA